MIAVALGLALLAPDGASPIAPPSPTQQASPGNASMVSLFSDDDYPAEAIRNEEQGTVSYRLTIGSDGRVRACEVTTSSGSARLDTATCTIIQRRARFIPARDTNGEAVEDHYSGRIKWVLPERGPTLFADDWQSWVLAADADGRITACRFESKTVPLANEDCPRVMREAQKMIEDTRLQDHLAGKEIVLRGGLMIGDSQAANSIGTGAGETRINHRAVALSIDAEGKVIECIPTSGNLSAAETAMMCAQNQLVEFEPLPPDAANRSDRHAVNYLTSYIRPRH